MKQLFSLVLILSFAFNTVAQESPETYQRALAIVKNSSEFKSMNIDRYTVSKQSISFINSAYAFYLEDPDLAFIDYDFENYFGEFYQPIDIKEFESLREKRRAKHILFVSETEQDHFIIELLNFKRRKRGKYPKFYSGVSYSFLFKKEADDSVKYLRTIRIANQ